MKRRILTAFIITVFAFLILGGCSVAKRTACEIGTTNRDLSTDTTGQTEATENTSETHPEDENLSGGLVSEPETEPTTDVNEPEIDELLNLSEEPSYGFVWALDEEAIKNAGKNPETIKYITYDGEPITVFCQISNVSSKQWEFGLFIEVEGILQELTVDGKKAEVYTLELQSLETRTVKMCFEPDIGKKDEIKNLSCGIILSPSYIAEEEGEYRMYHDPAISGNFPLVMNADAPKTADVSNNTSLYTVSEINKRIYSNYEEGNNLEQFENYPGCYVYETLKDYLKKENGSYVRKTRITTKASQNSELIINLHGKPGTYRVSLYHNGERLNAFEGKGYIDVTIGKNQQAEIPVTIDTRELKGANRIEAYYKEINCNFVDGDAISSSGVQKYVVK